MINIESLTTAYDLPITLVEWLKKIENLLNNGGVKAVNVVEVEGGYQLVITYNDDSTMTSDIFTLGDISALQEAINVLQESVEALQSDITTLNNKFAVYSFVGQSGFQVIRNNIKRVNNTLIIDVALKASTGISANTILGYINLPSDIFNKINLVEDYYFNGFIQASTGNKSSLIQAYNASNTLRFYSMGQSFSLNDTLTFTGVINLNE